MVADVLGDQENGKWRVIQSKKSWSKIHEHVVPPKSFHIWAYVLVHTKADLHQTDGYGKHVINYPNQDNFGSGRGTNDNYARTKV